MTTATQPRRKYNRQKARRHRHRPGYPTLETLPRGKAGDVERPTCGVNKGLALIDPATGRHTPARITSGTYVFERELPRPSRSKYCPHKEAEKHGASHR